MKTTINGMNAVLIITLLTMEGNVFAAESLTATEAVDRMQKNYEAFKLFRSETVLTEEVVRDDGTKDIFRKEGTFLYDGNRMNWFVHEWSSLESTDESVSKKNATQRNIVWDGESFYEYRREADHKEHAKVVIKKNDALKQSMISVGFSGASFMGSLPGDFEPITEILRQAKTVDTHFDGTAHLQVLTAETEHGDYQIWLDPEFGYNLVRVEAVKTENDILWGSANHQLSRFSFTLENVKFEMVNDNWIPVSADFEKTSTFRDGTSVTSHAHYMQTNIDFNPNLDGDAFKPTIVDGTRAYVEGFSGVLLEWKQGRFRAMIDQRFLDALDSQTDELLLAGELSPDRVGRISPKGVDVPSVADISFPKVTASTAAPIATASTAEQINKRPSSLWIGMGLLVMVAAGGCVLWRRTQRIKHDQ